MVSQFRNAGHGMAVDSWIGTEANQPISPGNLATALTPEQIAFLCERTGLSRKDLLAGLSARLPGVVDRLTPNGRVPSLKEMQGSL